MSKKIQAEIIELKKENDELKKRLDELVKGTLILHDIIVNQVHFLLPKDESDEFHKTFDKIKNYNKPLVNNEIVKINSAYELIKYINDLENGNFVNIKINK
jgi:hypothetical protein